jgi:PASTA domain
VAMISIDNTKSPFIKSRRLRKDGDYFRRGGVRGYRVPSTGYRLEGSGSGDAGQEIWRPVMQEYLKRVPNTSFNDPPRRIEVGRQVTVPNVGGLGISAAIRKFERAGFTVETSYVYHDTIPQYGFIGWSPSPGESISEFGTIYLMRSRGRDPAIVAREQAEAQQQADEEARKKAEEEARKKAEEERKRRERENRPPGPRGPR